MDNIDNLYSMMSSYIKDSIDNLEEFAEELNGDVDLNVNYPYLIFDKLSLVRAMNLCNKLIQSKSDISSYNSISLVPNINNSTIYFYATNDISHFRMFTELLGDKTEMLDMSISIPFVILQKLVKLMGNKILVYKKESNIYIRLLDGDLLLDYRVPNMDIITFPGKVEDDRLAELDLKTFGYITSSFLPLLNSEMRSESRRVYFDGEQAYLISNTYYMHSKIKTPKLLLGIKDVEFFSKLFKYYKDGSIVLFKVSNSAVPRVFVKLDNIEYQFINVNHSDDNPVSQQLEKFNKEPECSINYERFSKIVALSHTLPTSTNNIALFYNDSVLNICISTLRGDSTFSVKTNILVDKLYEDKISVNSGILKILLSVFSSSDMVNLSMSDSALILSNNSIKVVLMHSI